MGRIMGKDKVTIIKDSRLEQLTLKISDLQEDATLNLLERLISEGLPPPVLLDSCLEGMRMVGKRFEQGGYFIAALIMAGEIMRRATEILGPRLLSCETEKNMGKMLLGTVQGDIHDLGKNIYASLLQFDGVEVIDLGVDVDPEIFLAKTKEMLPVMVGLSCVLTSCIQGLRDTVDRLHRELGKKCPPVIIGGACIDDKIREFSGAEFWAPDAPQGLIIYNNFYKKIHTGGTHDRIECT
jgi:methanogenic corrinoid protein MtbC1